MPTPRRDAPVPSARLIAALLACACTSGAHGEPAPAPAREPTPPPAPAREPAPAPAPVVATCALASPKIDTLQLGAVAELGVAAGKSWHVAEADGAATLLHLGPAGLTRTPLPQWTEDVAAEPAALRLLRAAAPATWWSLDLRDPDVPTLGPAAAIPGLVPGEYPKGFASDGARALVSLYRESNKPDGPRYQGDTFLLEVPGGARIGPRADMTVWTAECHAGACFGVAAINDDPDVRALVALDGAGARRIGALGRWGCVGLETWREGQTWTIAWSEERVVGVAALDLATGAVTTVRIPTDDRECAPLRHLAVGGRHGLMLTATRSGRAFVPIGPDLRPGVPEPLPPLTGAQQRFADLGDGVLVADFTAASGLQKDRRPDPDGKIEYDEVWSFSGRVGVLRPAPAGWTLADAAPLPHDGEDGRMAGGYAVHLLTRPGRAGVLLVGDGLPSAFALLRGPCPERPAP
jgi:hypothetical protein